MRVDLVEAAATQARPAAAEGLDLGDGLAPGAGDGEAVLTEAGEAADEGLDPREEPFAEGFDVGELGREVLDAGGDGGTAAVDLQLFGGAAEGPPARGAGRQGRRRRRPASAR